LLRAGEGQDVVPHAAPLSAEKSVVANMGGEDIPREERTKILQQMHQDLLDNPEATEAAHKLYESLGVPSAVPTLEERIARNRAEAQALIAELQARQAPPQSGNGGKPADGPDPGERLPNGLRELPPHMQANGEGSH
jgi:hypothetical protein